MSSIGISGSMSVTRTRTPAGWAMQIALPATVLLSLGIWFNILYASRMKEPDLPGLLIPWLVQEAFFLVVATGAVWTIGRQTDRPMRWVEIVAVWFTTSIVHIISGGYGVFNLLTASAGEQLSDIPTVVSIFTNSGTTFLGAVINQVAFDELIHLGLFGAIVGRRFGWRSWGWFSLLLIIPYVLTVVGYELFFRMMLGK